MLQFTTDMKYPRRFFDPTFRRHEKRSATMMACVLLWSVLSYLVISRGMLSGAQVIGESMYPTLTDGDRVFLNRLVYRLEPPRRGDVVAVDVPNYDGMSVKRVIALPGETVQIVNNSVFVNGRQLDEPYLADEVETWPGAMSTNAYQVAPVCYFVLGDNREESLDSRRFGAVSWEWIRGRIAGFGFVEYKY